MRPDSNGCRRRGPGLVALAFRGVRCGTRLSLLWPVSRQFDGVVPSRFPSRIETIGDDDLGFRPRDFRSTRSQNWEWNWVQRLVVRGRNGSTPQEAAEHPAQGSTSPPCPATNRPSTGHSERSLPVLRDHGRRTADQNQQRQCGRAHSYSPICYSLPFGPSALSSATTKERNRAPPTHLFGLQVACLPASDRSGSTSNWQPEVHVLNDPIHR